MSVRINQDDPNHLQYTLNLQYVVGVLNGINAMRESAVLEKAISQLMEIAQHHASIALAEDKSLEQRIGFNNSKKQESNNIYTIQGYSNDR